GQDGWQAGPSGARGTPGPYPRADLDATPDDAQRYELIDIDEPSLVTRSGTLLPRGRPAVVHADRRCDAEQGGCKCGEHAHLVRGSVWIRIPLWCFRVEKGMNRRRLSVEQATRQRYPPAVPAVVRPDSPPPEHSSTTSSPQAARSA